MNRKRRILSVANKMAIVQLYGKKVTQSEIARLLDLNKPVVSRVICRHNECGSTETRPRIGRLPLLSPRAKRVLFKDVKKSRNATLQEITHTFNPVPARRVSKPTLQRGAR